MVKLRLFSDPLIHFLLAGFVLFLAHLWFDSKNDSEQRIVVRHQDLLTFMQYRAKKFDKRTFIQQWEAMTEEDREQLVNDYVREEVLYREASSLGLSNNDYVIRRRMLQKMEFIAEDISTNIDPINDKMLDEYYAENRQRYYIEPSITFTHVFFDSGTRPNEEAKQLAEKNLTMLNKAKVPFSESSTHGDRFPYYLNYVDRSYAEISNHFGDTIARELRNASVSEGNWIGPFESRHGFHIVMVRSKKTGKQPLLAEIRQRLKQDLRVIITKQAREEAIDTLMEKYQVVVELNG